MARRTLPEQPRRGRTEGLPAPEAWRPPSWDLADATAIQALARNDASPDQQRRALKYIIEQVSGRYDQPWRPGGVDGQRATDFACGRLSVGAHITYLINLNLAKFRKAEPGEQPAPSEQG